MEQTKTFLKTVPFTDFLLWDVKRYISNTLKSTYPLISLSKLISERSERLKLYDYPHEEFKILGVNNKTGLFDAYCELGININQSYKKVYNEDLAYNPYRINVGSIGWKTPNQKNEFISPAYVVFETSYELSSEYLYLMFQTNTFNKIINDNTTGSVRQNLKFDTLVNIKIPLPPLSVQNRIVSQYNQKIQLAIQQEQQATNLNAEIEKYLYKALNLDKNVAQQKEKGLQFTSLNQTSRWDTLFLIGNMPVLQTSYPIKQFKDVISKFNKGPENESIRINSKDYPNDEFVYIGMEHIEKETGNLLEIVKVRGEEIKSQTLRVPQDYLLYGKLRPYLNKYWINETSYDNIITSSEFFVFDIKTGINKQFFKYVLSSSFIQQQITDKTSGARMPRINETIFYNLQFPLPDYDKQNEIANHIDDLKSQIKALRKKANSNREEALLNFEQEIFNS